jgi:hypothetical protein
MKNLIAISSLVFIFSCNYNHDSKAFISPSEKLKIYLDKDYFSNDSLRRRRLNLLIYNKNDQILTSEQTNVLADNKWASVWHPLRDTFLLYSQGTGVLAWRFDLKNIIQAINPDFYLDSLVMVEYNKKYK